MLGALVCAASWVVVAPVAAQPPGPLQRAHVDVLFIGAHPDDEFQSLAAFGQWIEDDRLRVAVATITRGEGGGNAVGPEEGAPLGLLREKEERRAVGFVGIRDVYYLDKPDFWYTLSAPLTASVWDGPPQRADTLERLVRLIRATTPKVVVTMDPRPFNQHGAHQLAGRLATEAFLRAGDANAFGDQITGEGYRPWQADRLLAQYWDYPGPTGRGCATANLTDPRTGLPLRGVWEGTWSKRYNRTWAQRERDAARVYVSQGFGALPKRIDTPREELGCDWFTVLADGGEPVPPRSNPEPKPLYDEFARWAAGIGMPWLATRAQPDYPANPATTVEQAARKPVVDGKFDEGEYPGTGLRLGYWQGTPCKDENDCSATVHLSRHGDDLYAFFDVTDDVRGTALPSSDCKRHWRTDSVELTVDPRGRSDDTSTTYKLAVLPFTSDDGSCAARDADQHQGPADGVEHASVPRDTGYTVEVRIPVTALPARVDPDAMTVNLLLYDSDTQDKVGKTRLAWSPFGSAQADPYAWGLAELPSYTPPARAQAAPVIPTEAASSCDSFASRWQSRRTGVPLGAGRPPVSCGRPTHDR
ncbi:PIG-L family deacetylase [Saccharothrix sp. S26]|uniref:sugar-binding protein n=1 Tax=Saccharothrix sp. S26 TaxID=2907215 RepID=UPI001F378980|nr:sugar-binding protein [Saccharothrix sp. S26]MCE6998379.1 PIG-L family deacetylase [Saccharothrix sp. S26]